MAGITEDDLDWAEREAKRLLERYDHERGTLTTGIEFLRLKAGPRSEFYLRAADAARRYNMSRAPEVVASALSGWVDLVRRGIAELPVEAQARAVAATDLMEQVETLLADNKVHPAAPVMLAGAGLEEMLRSMVDAAGVKPKGSKPGISSYATALRAADVITAQDVKDVTAWAGLRNYAAHGQFDRIERANAQLMAQAINLFMQKHAP